VIPDGDRRHGAVSRDIVGEVQRRVEWHQNVMGVFILRNDLFDAPHGLLSEALLEDIVQRSVAAHLAG